MGSTSLRHAAIVAAVALASSLTGLRNDFALDDVTLIELNQRVHGFGYLGDILTRPYWPPPYSPDLYRPLASILMALQWTLGDGAPIVFRLVSLVLYVAACIAVYGAARRILVAGNASRQTPDVARGSAAAFGVGALFAAHPVHVEAVAQGVNQGELIVALLAALMLSRYLDARAGGGPAPLEWLKLAVLYAGAALTKENGFVLPGLLIAAELCIVDDRSPLGERASRLWPGFAALAVVGATLIGVRTLVLGGDVVGAYTAEALVGLGLGGRVLTMLSVVPTWLRLLAWPAHLQADYGPNEIVAATGWGASELIGLGIVLAAAALAWRYRRSAIGFGVACTAISLLPVSNLVPTSIVVAERTLFLPSFGFLLVVVAGLSAVAGRAGSPAPGTNALGARALLVAMATFTTLGVARSATRQTAWRNSAHLWSVTAGDAPKSLRVQRAHREAVQDLVTDFTTRLAGAPEKWAIRNEFAALLRAMGEDSLAVEQYRLSLDERPGQPSIRALLDSARARKVPCAPRGC